MRAAHLSDDYASAYAWGANSGRYVLGLRALVQHSILTRHSAHDVLHYAPDSIAGPPLLLQFGGQLLLETCWWVPIAFGGAGVILGADISPLDLH